MTDPLLIGVGLLVVLAAANLLVLLLRTAPVRAEAEATRQALLATQRALEVGQRMEAEAVRGGLLQAERALSGRAQEAVQEAHALRTDLVREQGEQRVLLEAKLREMNDQAALRLSDIQRSVNERLEAAVQKEVQGSFQRVIDQFAQVQKAMGDVQAITGQIGDLKRIFTNVKSRGGWGEQQLRALLQDMLPDGGWEANRRLRADSDEVVEFVLIMPAKADPRPVIALDAKFPAEDYDRLLLAAEAGDAEGERAARKALEARLRSEGRKIASKYILPPVTVDFAIMYLPTDSLYVEAARMPGLIDTLGREHRVLLMGPALLPALVRTIAVGAMSLTIAENAKKIEHTLAAVRGEFRRIDEVLGKLEKQTGQVNRTVAQTRLRTRQMDRKLQGVAALAAEEADTVLALEDALIGVEDDETPE